MKISEYFNDTQTTIERDFTVEELKQYDKDKKELAELEAKKLAEEIAKKSAKQAILDRIGLTTEELQTILG
jgi:hypothetical protein